MIDYCAISSYATFYRIHNAVKLNSHVQFFADKYLINPSHIFIAPQMFTEFNCTGANYNSKQPACKSAHILCRIWPLWSELLEACVCLRSTYIHLSELVFFVGLSFIKLTVFRKS